LHLDVQRVLETSETADLDNYAKSILDGLKGPDGILLDDTQVQTLTISWINNYGHGSGYFDVAISASPDDFILKPISFYEMPDKLWYPHGRRLWTDGVADEQSDGLHYTGLVILEVMSSGKANTRHLLRQMGMDSLGAYQRALPISSSARGFHKSRIDPGDVASRNDLHGGGRVSDVGCGTGNLTFILPEIANVTTVTGIDLTGAFVEFALAHNSDPRISFRQADARVLPFEDNSFDRAFSMLVLQFIPDAACAVAEKLSCRAPRRHRDCRCVGCLRRHVAHTHPVGHCRRARSLDRATVVPTIESAK
jgi:hypothetical protein